MHYVYVLKSLTFNNRLYIGRTNNLKLRIQEHLSGKTWTTARMGKLELIYFEAFKAKGDAVRRERYLKTSKGKSSLRQIIRYSVQ